MLTRMNDAVRMANSKVCSIRSSRRWWSGRATMLWPGSTSCSGLSLLVSRPRRGVGGRRLRALGQGACDRITGYRWRHAVRERDPRPHEIGEGQALRTGSPRERCVGAGTMRITTSRRIGHRPQPCWVSDWRGSGKPTTTPSDLDGNRGSIDRHLDPWRGARGIAADESGKGAPERRL